jgi:hypothetical protein
LIDTGAWNQKLHAPQSPSLVMDNVPNSKRSYTVFFGETGLFSVSSRVASANGINVSLRKFCQGMFLSIEAHMRKVIVPIGSHLTHVLSAIPKHQVIWANTMRAIASGASMQNGQAFRNGSSAQNPRSTMGVDFEVSSFEPLDHSVPPRPETTARAGAAKPDPMVIRNFHLRPKAFWKRFGKPLACEVLGTKVRPRNQVHFGYVTLGAVTGRAWAPLTFGLSP